jgi:hypothetical protein
MPTALIGSATRPHSHFGAFPLRSIPASAHSHFGAFPSAHVSTRVLTVLPNTRPRVAAVRTSAPGPAGLHWAHPRLPTSAPGPAGLHWAHPRLPTSAPGPAGLHWAHPRLVAHIGTGTAWAHPRLVAHIGTGTRRTALGSPPTSRPHRHRDCMGSPPRRPSCIRTGTGPPDCPHRHRECDATAQQNVLQQRAPVATASLREYP